MKRRKGRRKARAGRSPLRAAPGLIALAVVVAAAVLIARGDRTPRPHRTEHHRHGASAALAGTTPAAGASAQSAPANAPPAVSASTPPTLPPGVPPTLAPAGASPAPAAGPPAPGTDNVPPTLPPPGTAALGAPPSAPNASGAPIPSATPSGARLALIIDDCGQWPDTERGFIALPVALTLSVLPHVRYGDAIARDARAAGKGVMLHLPMEPRSGAYPGPGEIKVAMDDAAIAAQVRDDMASVPLANGANNHEGSRATADDRVMRAVSAALAERHLFFVDSRTGADSVAARDAAQAGLPTASRDVFLDDVAELGATEDELRRAAALAKRNGSAIAIGHPRPTTLAAVRALLPELRRDGIDFVPVADLVR